nr:hypothetical protein [uncultured Roseobacter sp.]
MRIKPTGCVLQTLWSTLFAEKSNAKRFPKNAQIQCRGPVGHIPKIQPQFFFVRQSGIAADLRPACQSGSDSTTQTSRFAKFIDRFRQQRSGPDKRHATPQDEPELRDFIQTQPAHQHAYPRLSFGVWKQCAARIPFFPHRPQFGDVEGFTGFARSGLPKKNRTTEIDPDQTARKEEDRERKNADEKADQDFKQAIHNTQ